MSGTRAGGLKAKATNLSKDPDFYKKIGRIGGQNGHTGGFAANKALAIIAGQKGGRKSRRGPAVKPRAATRKAECVGPNLYACIMCGKYFLCPHSRKTVCSDECKKKRDVELQNKYRADRRVLTK